MTDAPTTPEPADRSPASPQRPSRLVWWIAASVSAGVVVCALGLGLWWWLSGIVWTDGASIRRSGDESTLRQVLWTDPDGLSAPINSDAQEYEPALTPDGDQLVFVRGLPNHDGQDQADLFIARRTEAGWAEPQPLQYVNTAHNELGPRISRDGRWLYFYSDRPGGQGQYDIWVASRDGDGQWRDPVNLGPTINSRHNDYSPAPAPDGRLFFTTNRIAAEKQKNQRWQATVREREVGDYDIFLAEPAPRKAAAPEPSRPVFAQAAQVPSINSPRHDGACCVSPLGDFLYFASNRDGGLGGFDLYRARLVDGMPVEPVNLGPEINSAANEADPELADDGFTLMLSSDRAHNDGVYDLYQSHSREVYAQRQRRTLPGNWSWWLLAIALAVLIPVLLFLKAAGYQHLSALQKAVAASVLIHILLTVLLGLLFVSGEIIQYAGKKLGLMDAVAVELSSEAAVRQAVRSHQFTHSASDASDVRAQRQVETVPHQRQETSVDPQIRPEVREFDVQPRELPQPQAERADVRPPEPVVESRPEFRVPQLARTQAQPDKPLTEPVRDDGAPLARTDTQTVEQPRLPAATRAEAPPIEAVGDIQLTGVPGTEVVLPSQPQQVAVAAVLPQNDFTHTLPSHRPLPQESGSSRPEARPQTDERLPVRRAAVEAAADAQPDRAASAPPLPEVAAAPGPLALDVRPAVADPLNGPPLDLPLPDPVAAAPDIGHLSSPLALATRSFPQRRALVLEMGGSDESEAAVERALAYLARTQEKAGHWSHKKDSHHGDPTTALTGLATLCFLAHDHHWANEDSQYGPAVRKAVDAIVARQKADGDLRGGGNMYGHGIATVALAEAATMTGDPKVREAALKAARFIIKAQNPDSGGWRYVPYFERKEEGDMSVVGWQVMALHSAKSLGLQIPDETRRRALRYIYSVSNGGRAGYTSARQPSPAMTAEAIFSRILLEDDNLKPADVEAAGGYMVDAAPSNRNRERNYYSWYYTSLALVQVRGKHWDSWNKATRDYLIRLQEDSGPNAGSWSPDSKWGGTGGRTYTTAAAALTLQAYYRYPSYLKKKE